MMEALNDYGRPFHQRAREMVVPPLSPLEVGAMLDLAAADAFDAYLVTGGLPLIRDEWPAGTTMWEYLGESLADPTSALLVSGERALAVEFPPDSQARLVLSTVGAGERTFTTIGQRAGGLRQASLTRTCGSGSRSSAHTWPRSNAPAADHAPVARRVDAVGSIKWLDTAPFDQRDLARLITHRAQPPDANEATPLLAVSRTGNSVTDLRVLGPDELLDAWRQPPSPLVGG